MGKNKGAGGKNRRKGKNMQDLIVHETVFREDGMDYGYVLKTLGSGRFHIYCQDGQTRLGILRGTLRRKVWIINGDMVLYGLRTFQDAKVDIVHKYSNDDVHKLYRYEEITKQLYDTYTSDTHSTHEKTDTDNIIDFMNETDDNHFMTGNQPISSSELAAI